MIRWLEGEQPTWVWNESFFLMTSNEVMNRKWSPWVEQRSLGSKSFLQ